MAMQSGFIKRIRDIMRMDAGINGDAQRIEQMVWMLFLKVYDAKEDDWELNEDDYESIIPEDLRWRNWAKADENGHAMTGDKLLNFVNNTLFPVLKGNDVKEGDTIIYKGIHVTPDTPVKKAIVKSTFEDANNYMKDGVYLRQVIDVIDEIEFDDVKESHAFGFVYEEILRELQSAGSSGEFYTPRAVTEFMALMIKPQLGEKMADFACGTGGFITSWLGQLSKQVTDTTAQKQLDDSIYGIEKKPFPYLLCVTNMLLHDIEVPNIYHMNSLKHNLLDYTDEDKFDVILMNPPYGGHTEGYKKAFIEKSEAETIFGRSVFCYFGPDRYEKPAWMGKRYYQQDEDIHPSIRERWQGQLRKPITVHDVNDQTLQWLLDIIADSRCDIIQEGNQLLVEHADMGSLLLQGAARKNVENIMTEILGKNVYFGLNYRNRGKSRFNICNRKNTSVLIPSLDALSTGQSALFNMFATIVRYSDDNNINNSITLSQIEGVVIIDEVELHLHSNLQRNTLPKLMKLFPKVQFVITTHSPLFLLGLEEVYGTNGFEIHEMPNGDCISAEAFSEFQKAYAFYSETKKHQTEIKEAINTHTAKPLVITEGATDWKHMKAAFAKLSQCPENIEAYKNLSFDFLEYEPEQSTKDGVLKIQMSNTQLTSMCKHFASIPQPRKLIFIADADDTSTNKELGSEAGFKAWGNNVYSFTIPVPAHRADTPKICIEHYYSDNDIKTQVEINGVQRRIYMGNEFDSVGISVDGQLCCVDRNSCGPDKIRIIDGTSDKRVFCIQGDRKTNLALPKMEFADRVLGNSPEYSNIDFSSFSLIFDLVKQICEHTPAEGLQ